MKKIIEESKNKIEIIIDGKLNPLYFENVKKEAEKNVKEIFNKNGLVNYKDKINQDQAKKKLEQHFFSQFIKEWGLKNENELDNLSKKIQEQEQKIKDLKSDNFQSKDVKIEPKKEKDNTDFLNQFYKFKSNLSPNIGLINDAFEQNLKKAEKIESDIKDVKDKSEKVDSKIDDLSNSSLSQTQKDKLFAELEKDILNLKSAVKKLKGENQNLKKELELLIEKNKIESHKTALEKENESLTSKIESLKNKTQNSKAEFQEKTTENKITYKQSKESQLIKDYENLNDNQKEK